MVLKNIRQDLVYKTLDNIVMLHNSLNTTLNVDQKIVYSLIANFDDGLEVKCIFELMEPKGWNINDLNNIVNSLLYLNYIEDISDSANHEIIKKDFDNFKKVLFQS